MASATSRPDAQLLKPLLETIRERIAWFNTQWPAHTLAAEVYPIDYYPVDDDGRPVVPDDIRPGLLTAGEAIEASRQALAQLRLETCQHPNTVFRLPGVVIVDQIDHALIAEINNLKQQLHALITDHVPPGSRTVLTRDLFKGYSMMQVYRRINVIDHPLRKLAFTWAGNTTASRRLTVDEAVTLVESTRQHKPWYMEGHEWSEVIRAELNAIQGLPAGARLKIRKPIAPHPRLQTYRPGGTRPDEMLHAHLPVFVVSKPDSVPEILPMKPWCRTKRSQVRHDHHELLPIAERIYLYAQLE